MGLDGCLDAVVVVAVMVAGLVDRHFGDGVVMEAFGIIEEREGGEKEGR